LGQLWVVYCTNLYLARALELCSNFYFLFIRFLGQAVFFSSYLPYYLVVHL